MDTCDRCKGTIVEVPTNIGGEELVLRRCSFCDSTQWRRGAEIIDLRDVLDLTADAHPKGRRVVRSSEDQAPSVGTQ